MIFIKDIFLVNTTNTLCQVQWYCTVYCIDSDHGAVFLKLGRVRYSLILFLVSGEYLMELHHVYMWDFDILV
jgi:hypothetical protein